MMEGKL